MYLYGFYTFKNIVSLFCKDIYIKLSSDIIKLWKVGYIMKKKTVYEALAIIFGSLIYAIGINFFIFPTEIVLGGTSGISVILSEFLPFSPVNILGGINFLLIIVAYIILGVASATKTLFGSFMTTFFGVVIGNMPWLSDAFLIENLYLSAILGALVIAFASAVLFFVNSSSGGTDIIALIIEKYSEINIGNSLLITDILIVIVGGMILGIEILIASIIGIIIKTQGINAFNYLIKRVDEKVAPSARIKS